MRGIVDRAQIGLPSDIAPAHSFAYASMAKLWSGNKLLHYEAWLRERLGVIELGLHFEADALTNARLLAAFRARERAIRRGLGADVRIETWDRGWARVWEPVSLVPLDQEFLERIGERVGAYIRVLEPILLSELPADVAWSESTRRR